MKKIMPEQYRMKVGPFGTTEKDGARGIFIIPVEEVEPGIKYYQIILSNGMGWDHLSVILLDEKKEPSNVIPGWQDMCFLKDTFLEPEETVMQLHPPHSEYVNNHKYCLHLWRPQSLIIPLPDSIMVGLKTLNHK